MLRKKKKEREREKEILSERESLFGCLPYMPQLGNEPKTQTCALTGNLTGNLSVHRMMMLKQQLTKQL